VTSNANWITILGSSTGVGSGPISYLVAANGGGARAGVIIAANQQYTVSQSAVANVALQFTNYLIYPVTISVNGSTLGTVNASSNGAFTVTPTTQTLSVSFELTRPTVGGAAIGDPMLGYWTINNPVGTYTLTINNQIGNQEYFVPIITNNTGHPLLMDVNIGLAAENRCNCVVPTAGSNVAIGYYRFFSNSTVDAFPSTSNYAGQYSYFHDLASFVQADTGVLYLTFK
jgi:hypothetical protein